MDLLTETSRKRYRGTSAWIFFTETIFFHPKQLKYTTRGLGTLRTTPFSLFIGKRGRRLPPRSPRRAGLLPPDAIQLQKIILKGPIQNFKISICTPPILLSSPPFLRNIRKSYGSLTKAYRT